MKQALKDRTDRHDDLVASGRQIEMVFKRGQKTLSLRAQKFWHLLIKATGVRLGEDTEHVLPLSALREGSHMRIEGRLEALRELQTTLVEVRTIEDGKSYVRSGALLSNVACAVDEDGLLKWEFSKALRVVFANSDHWAVLSRRAVMAFESRYSLRLYEIISLRAGLTHKTTEIFDLETLRDRLGVPIGKFERWPDFRRFVLESAIAEVNQLAGFHLSYEAIKHSRSVASVKLLWGEKSRTERAETKRELDSHKIGRKARRIEKTETIEPKPPTRIVSAGFPTDGSISFGKWGEMARLNLPRPTPDVDLVATAFRKWASAKNAPLNDKTFVGFCKKWNAR